MTTRTKDDAGAVRVKLVVISLLTLAVLAVAAQAVVYFHARSVIASAASDAARAEASGEVASGAGAGRAEELIAKDLSDADAAAITCTSSRARGDDSGLQSVTVRCSGRVHVLFTSATVPWTIEVSSTALVENQ